MAPLCTEGVLLRKLSYFLANSSSLAALIVIGTQDRFKSNAVEIAASLIMAIRDDFSIGQIALSGLIIYFVVHRIYRVSYDLKIHPLSHVPSPKLAAITYLYQTYYSLAGGSCFYIQIGKLHKKYGMSQIP